MRLLRSAVLGIVFLSANSAWANWYGASIGQPPNLQPGRDPLFSFTISIGPDTGFGTLTATDEGGGVFLATSGTLTVTGSSNGNVAVGTYSLIPNPSGLPVSSPSGYFLIDDLFYPASDPTLDTWGLLFGAGGTELNVWGNSPGNYSFYTANSGFFPVADTGAGTVSFTETPEPSSVFLLIGALAVPLYRRRSLGGR
jgi:hypothetical protein